MELAEDGMNEDRMELDAFASSGGLATTMESLADGLLAVDAPEEDDMDDGSLDPSFTVGTFFVGDLELALGANCVREVVTFAEKVTPVSRAGECVVGIFSLRGEIMPIIDIASLLGVDRAMPLEQCRIAIIDVDDGHIGILFSRTGEVLRVPPEDCFPLDDSAHQLGMITDAVLQIDSGQRLIQRIAPSLVREIDGIPFTGAGSGNSAVRKPPVVYRKAVVAKVGPYSLAFSMESLVEIRERTTLQPSPEYFLHCKGVLHVRGVMFTALGLRECIGLEPQNAAGKLVFVRHDGVTIALEVDSLVASLEYPEDGVLPLPSLPSDGVGGFCQAVLPTEDQSQVLLVDVEALFDRNQVGGSATILNHDKEEESEDEEHGLMDEDRSLFTFTVGKYFLSLEMVDVLEVQRVPESVVETGVVDGALQGIMDLRGTIVPLVDLRTLFATVGEDIGDGEADAASTDPVVIVIEHDGGSYGMIVDRIESVIRFQASQANEVPTALNGRQADGVMPYVATALILPAAAGHGKIALVLSAEALAGSVVLTS